MTFIVATYVDASQPAERRPTGTSHARAKNLALFVSYVPPSESIALSGFYPHRDCAAYPTVLLVILASYVTPVS